MFKQLRDYLRFRLERFLLGEPQFRLLVILAMAVLIISVSGGSLKYWADDFSGSYGDALWWAFLRLTDTGYLGDDEGSLQRLISTMLTISGGVLFVGGLVAVMTQWLNQTIRSLEKGLTPLILKGHIVILGWTTYTPDMVAELSSRSLRLTRFLLRNKVRRLRLAILVDEVSQWHHNALQQRLHGNYSNKRIMLRSGEMNRPDDLKRVDVYHAGAIVIPMDDSPPENFEIDDDTRLLKTLMTLARQVPPQNPPLVVAAVRDHRRRQLIRDAYIPGASEILAADLLMARVLMQIIRQPGLSKVIAELINHQIGCSLHIIQDQHLAGQPFAAAAAALPQCVVLGLLRHRSSMSEQADLPLLNPEPDCNIEAADRLIVLAREAPHVQNTHTISRARPSAHQANSAANPQQAQAKPQHLLIIGWNHLLPVLVHELVGSYPDSTIHLANTRPISERQHILQEYQFANAGLNLHHHVGDFSQPFHLQSLPLEQCDTIAILGSERLISAEEADARSIATHQALRSELLQRQHQVQVVVELRDPKNAQFFTGSSSEVLPSGVMITHFLSQVTLRRELACVFEDLFAGSSASLAFVPLHEIMSNSAAPGLPQNFAELSSLARDFGLIALGVHHAGSELNRLNPTANLALDLSTDDALICLR